jgi:cell division protein FtsQ
MSPDEERAPVSEEPMPVVRVPEADEPVVLRIDESRRRSLRRWAIAGGAAVVIAVLALSLTATPLFHAKAIRVEGERRLSERQVRRAAGVDGQTNVFSLDEGAVSRRLERNPWILDVMVTTSLPSTVQIRVTERVPVALVDGDDGVVFVAGDGSILGRATGAALPQIRPPEVAVGQPQAAVSAPMLVAAANAAAEFGATLRPQIETIVVQPDGTLILELRDGVTVTYGGASDLAAKAEALRAILDHASEEERDLISIDLRTPSAPTARFVGVPVPAQPTVSPDDNKVETKT